MFADFHAWYSSDASTNTNGSDKNSSANDESNTDKTSSKATAENKNIPYTL